MLVQYLAVHCVPMSINRYLISAEIYCAYHVTDSARTATRLLPLLVRPSGTVSRTLSAIRTPPKLLFGGVAQW